MQITLLILVLNERTSLEAVVPELLRVKHKKNFNRMLAIDGGSTDGSVEYLKKKRNSSYYSG